MTYPELTPSESSAINAFLSTPVGIRWVAYMMTVKPKVIYDKGMDTGALTGAFLAGYLYLLDEIIPRSRSVLTEEATTLRPIDMTKD